MGRSELHDGPLSLGPPKGESLADRAKDWAATMKALNHLGQPKRHIPEMLKVGHG
jgi:hypothetical protein